MSDNITFRISSAVLEWARISMGYTIEQAAKKAGVSNEKFEAWEKGEKAPTYKQLETLAEKVYKRPLAILFSQKPPTEDPIQKDFRNLSNSEIIFLSPEVRLALRKAKRYQLILDEVNQEIEGTSYKDFHVSLKDNSSVAAKRFREFLNFSVSEQKSWRLGKAFNNFKTKVESIGIYVFQLKMPFEEARAFCLTGKHPIIVLNTEDSINGRAFSLFHETCHIFFNVNGVFKDTASGELNKTYADIENFCNRFAASFLVPDEYFDEDIKHTNLTRGEWNEYQIQKLAQSYGVSNEVIARKLLASKYITEDFFWNKKRIWDSIAKSAKEKDLEKLKEQDVKGIAQDIKIISEKGKPYVKNVITAYQQGIISSSDLSNYLESKLDHLPKLIQRINS